jgi:predicted enzyme related to lactoylglutathione lyase
MPERDGYPDGEPCWADVVTPDLEAAQRFYGALFGWSFQNSGPEYGNYTMCLIGDNAVAAVTPPAPGSPAGVPPMWSVYLASSDVDETARRIERGGGKIMMAPMDIPGSGRMTYALDPTGAAFGVWQGGGHIGAQLTVDPGTPCWAELTTRDAAGADSFYRGLFDYEQVQIGDDEAFDYTVWSIAGRQVAGRLKMGDDTAATIPANWAIYFSVDDVDAAARRATEAGGELRFGPEDSPYGRFAAVSDPFGAVFNVIDLSTAEAPATEAPAA